MKSNPLVKINELIEQDYLIVVDTNVLLGLYRLSPDYADFALIFSFTIIIPAFFFM